MPFFRVWDRPRGPENGIDLGAISRNGIRAATTVEA
jgi:hypothetical protein